jgi:hypothetical protein
MKTGQIDFDPTKHQYSCAGTPYISATQLISIVTPKFDTEFHARRMADLHGQTPEFWKGRWQQISHRATTAGTEFHDIREAQSYATQMEVHRGKVVRVQNPELQAHISSINDIFYWPDGVYPEMLLFNHRYHLAGRADKVRLVTYKSGRRYAFISDYKTNKVIKKHPWFDARTGYRMLLPPLDHLYDCSYTIYSLQLSIYQFMLEQMGFFPGTRTLLHYPVLPEGLGKFPGERSKRAIKYKLDYLRDDVIKLLNYIHDGQQAQRPTNM